MCRIVGKKRTTLRELTERSYREQLRLDAKWYYFTAIPGYLADLKIGLISLCRLIFAIFSPIFLPVISWYLRRYHRKIAETYPDKLDSLTIEEEV